VVVRPHPFEDPEPYRERLSGVSNIEINTTGPVQPQIFQATAVIQRNCSTAIEAGLAGVPALSHAWIPTSIPIASAEAVSVACQSYEEMRSTLEEIVGSRYAPLAGVAAAIEEVVGEWFYRIDGEAHRRVAEQVLRHVDGPRRVDRRQCKRLLYGLNRIKEGLTVRASSRVRYALNMSPDWSFTRMRVVTADGWKQQSKYFDATEVRELADRIQTTAVVGKRALRRVTVTRAREHGDYVHAYHGRTTVRLSC
jgi:hypothetical protein